MDDGDRIRLKKVHQQLVHDLTVEHVIDALYAESVINLEKCEELTNSYITRQERCRKLLLYLPSRGPNAFAVFKEALKKYCPHLVDELDKTDITKELSAIRKKKGHLHCGKYRRKIVGRSLV